MAKTIVVVKGRRRLRDKRVPIERAFSTKTDYKADAARVVAALSGHAPGGTFDLVLVGMLELIAEQEPDIKRECYRIIARLRD